MMLNLKVRNWGDTEMSIAAQISIAFVYRLFLDVTWQPIWFKDKSQLDFFLKKIKKFSFGVLRT